MAKKFLTTIKLVNLLNSPSVGTEGELYYNSSEKVIKFYNGSAWKSLTSNEYYTSTQTISSSQIVVLDSWAVDAFTTLEYTLQIKQGSKLRSSKILILNNENLFYYTEYAIIEIGNQINGLLIDTNKNGSFGQFTIQISDAETNNAQVTIVRSAIT